MHGEKGSGPSLSLLLILSHYSSVSQLAPNLFESRLPHRRSAGSWESGESAEYQGADCHSRRHRYALVQVGMGDQTDMFLLLFAVECLCSVFSRLF
jgi:hypothetical protein